MLCVVDVKPATTPLHSSLRKYLRQMAVQLEHSMADSRDGNEADVSSNGVRSDEEGASLGEDSLHHATLRPSAHTPAKPPGFWNTAARGRSLTVSACAVVMPNL